MGEGAERWGIQAPEAQTEAFLVPGIKLSSALQIVAQVWARLLDVLSCSFFRLFILVCTGLFIAGRGLSLAVSSGAIL